MVGMTDPALTPQPTVVQGGHIPELADLANNCFQEHGYPPSARVAASAALPSVGAWSPGLRWRRVFPGEARELAALRRWLAVLLPECPARDDVMCVATELGSNALRHTASGRGGQFAVEIAWHASVAHVAVFDGGAPSGPRAVDDPLQEYGRGLLLVRELSLRYGVCGDQRGRLVWADVPCADPDAPALDRSKEVFDDSHRILGKRLGVMSAWLGRPILPQDMADRAGMVTAPFTARWPGHDSEEKDRMTQRTPGRPANESCGSGGQSAQRPPPRAVPSWGQGRDA